MSRHLALYLILTSLSMALFFIGGCTFDPNDDDGVVVIQPDDDDDNDGDECIACSSTAECADALGSGWGCVGDCCLQLGDDDDDDNDSHSDDDDDDTGDDDDDDTVQTKGRYCTGVESIYGPIPMSLKVGNVTFANVWSGECSSCRDIPDGSGISVELDWDGTVLLSGDIDIDTTLGSEWIFYSAMDGEILTLYYGPLSCSADPWEE